MPLSRLNAEQRSAATAPSGYNLIIASAGTGKTSTIVARIAHLLNHGTQPSKILLLTFTNKAAAEMLERVGVFFDKSITSQIESGTFHAVSYRLLKKLGRNIVLKQPKDLKILLKSIHDRRRFDHIDSSVKAYSAAYLYDLFSLYQNSTVTQSFTEWLESNDSEHGLFFDIYEDIFEEFQALKREFGYVDFNDLLILMRDTLKTTDTLSFDEVLIDEYQDTNTLQGSLIDAFHSKSLFCVGDYDQSIYAFNGANIDIIGSFATRYPNANVFTLNKNYRSSHKILSLANRVIEKNPRLYEKRLEVTRDGTFEAPKLLIYDELFSQYQAISTLIKHSMHAPADIAVIFRNNSTADGIEATLREQGIACKRKGGISFFDSAEVKAMLDLVGVVVNPKDMMAFIHSFEYARGVGSSLSKELFDGLFKLGNGNIYQGFFNPRDDVEDIFKKRAKNHQLGLFDDIIDLGSVSRFYNFGFEELFLSNPILKHPKLTTDGAKFLHQFYKFMKHATRIKTPQSLINHVLSSEVFSAIAEVLAIKRTIKKDGTIDEKLKAEARARIFRKGHLLKDLASGYASSERFLNALTLGSNEMSEGEGVNLLSIHASKGLEFKEVYVIDLMDGRFPNRKLMQKGGSLEEERRLFYVATTRAKDMLILSYAKYDKIKKISYTHSPFLVEAGMVH
ncbi:ATP-dependent helicase [Sulfurospirillum diekertiae]|uniref:DNA 3'-5' helicase n=1 Tax=Sulfurospirillum diekertiae TaxID=1854492 RepID=A0A1Y0HLQ3_9BACT|nr:ATP-dependent helicase [Sulfurospirillum diekertiae]ARU49021.1 ATP-dependent DNA helicase PcrA [Sulfurospirillum diekertiae]ASC93839.1 ATP-dependent DNA helicase PcrA [Sulfurospirillum diekertiae]QIR74947.1 ATP-dependent helicase [Sulfurospirillum diekertiae]QIR77611.1 ATP-dependent helicase [Sulfurospirillum diekertiae]